MTWSCKLICVNEIMYAQWYTYIYILVYCALFCNSDIISFTLFMWLVYPTCQDCFTSSGAIIRYSWCYWSNPRQYDLNWPGVRFTIVFFHRKLNSIKILFQWIHWTVSYRYKNFHMLRQYDRRVMCKISWWSLHNNLDESKINFNWNKKAFVKWAPVPYPNKAQSTYLFHGIICILFPCHIRSSCLTPIH